MTRLYSFPHHPAVLAAHCGYIGSANNTPEQEAALSVLRIMIIRAEELDPKDPISLELYSKLVICGEIIDE